ncbi:MAG: CRISPR-associated endonuclease Cas1 [Methanoregulaceae archaeon]|nr:CRISPR-associated endonuclease Cas1 [Methanoregulaceae archaeon]MCU0628328.1 CRISPR-associated endonuclease Cas1 [Methanoregulaceae archaeon]
MRYPWHIVTGFGAHLKATKASLVITKNGQLEQVPLDQIDHLLVMGGHFLHTSVINVMLRSGKSVSFFEADGEPLGILRPYGDHSDDSIRKAQDAAPSHSYALKFARAALINRIQQIESLQEGREECILYGGEMDIIRQHLSELEYLVRVDEIRRVHRLVTDMYYEIVARTIHPDLEFRRRTSRPYTDVINCCLSVGYGMLFGNACVSAIGARLEPDTGFLHTGSRGLIYDLIEPFKTIMIDRPLLEMVRGGVNPDEYECSPGRCILSDDFLSRITRMFHGSIRQEVLDEQVLVMGESLMKGTDFYIIKV